MWKETSGLCAFSVSTLNVMQGRLCDQNLIIVRKKPAEDKTGELKTKGTSSLRDLPGFTPTICAMVPAKSRNCPSIPKLGRGDTSHPHIMSKQPHTRKARPNPRAGEEVCSLLLCPHLPQASLPPQGLLQEEVLLSWLALHTCHPVRWWQH